MTKQTNSWMDHTIFNQYSNDLKRNIAHLMTGMMIVDEYLDEHEYDEITHFLKTTLQFNDAESLAYIEQLQNDQNIETTIAATAQNITDHYAIEERLEILAVVWSIALADGIISPAEEQYMDNLGRIFDISLETLTSLKDKQIANHPGLKRVDKYQEF